MHAWSFAVAPSARDAQEGQSPAGGPAGLRADAANATLEKCERLSPDSVRGQAKWKPYPEVASNDLFFARVQTLGLVD